MVGKERDPVLINEVKGFPSFKSEKSDPVQLSSDHKSDAAMFVRDLSSLEYDERSGHLLVLSDKSRLILELDPDGQPLSTISLNKGRHGLHKSAPQPEGISMDGDGTCISSASRIFFSFQKTSATLSHLENATNLQTNLIFPG